jgi:hypothetical protein
MASSIYTIQNQSNTVYNTDYGIDIGCTDDLPLNPVLVTSNTILANAAYRRLITPYGALGSIGGDGNYGIGVYSWLNSEITSANIVVWQNQCIQQFNLDPRIASSAVLLNYDKPSQTLTLSINLQPVIGNAFTMVVSVNNLTGATLNGVINNG